jgi:hypothetical protein
MSEPRCDTCGKFMRLEAPASWASIFDRAGMCLDHEAYRCGGCTELLGHVCSNATPHDDDMSPYQGIFDPAPSADLLPPTTNTTLDEQERST